MVKITTDRKIGIYAPSGYGKSFLADYIVGGIKVPIYLYDTDLEASKGVYFKYSHVHIYKPPIEKAEDLGHLSRYIMRILTTSNCFIYVEDLDLFFDTDTQMSKKASIIKYLASKGRHHRIGFIYTAKQLSHIPTKLRANTNLIYIGYYDDALEKDRIKKTLGKESYEQYYTKLDPKKHEFIELDTVARTIRIVSV